MQVQTERILYETCPLCESSEHEEVGQASCSRHPLYSEELPSVLKWRGCRNCGHVFTEGYFNREAQDVVFERALNAQIPGQEVERNRMMSSRIVQIVSAIRGSLVGRWLDVGFGNGSLLATAEEYGYRVVGLDLRASSVELMSRMDYDVHERDLADFEDPEGFDVISLADVLEHSPFPREVVGHARRLLRREGLLFLSLPNMDSFVWKSLDQRGENPYWGELEHYHNFGRDRLYALLRTSGFEPCHYSASERFRACMDVVAVRVEER